MTILSIQEELFFQDFSKLLKKHTAMDGKFSLWRVHTHHQIKADEVLHESSDKRARTSTTRVINKKRLPKEAFISQWLVKGDGTRKAAVWCCD